MEKPTPPNRTPVSEASIPEWQAIVSEAEAHFRARHMAGLTEVLAREIVRLQKRVSALESRLGRSD